MHCEDDPTPLKSGRAPPDEPAMAWLLFIGLVLAGLLGLRLVWKLMRWLGEHGNWPGDAGGSL